MINAIIYTSNTGSTKEYAELLSKELNIPAYSLKESHNLIKPESEIIYLGWVMGNNIQGFSEAKKMYKIDTVCAVGLNTADKNSNEIKQINVLPESTKLFLLKGGLNKSKLHGINKMIMSVVSRNTIKKLQDKDEITNDEADILDLMIHGGSRVSIYNLTDVIDWCRKIS